VNSLTLSLALAALVRADRVSGFPDLPAELARQSTNVALLLLEILFRLRSVLYLRRIRTRSVDDLDLDLVATWLNAPT
jgi:hypothetical protein